MDNWYNESMFRFSKPFEHFSFEICFCICCVYLYYKLLFLMSLSVSVPFSVYMNIIFHIFWKLSRSVNNFRTNLLSFCFYIWFEICCPPIPIPGVSQSSLAGAKYRNNIFLVIFDDLYEKRLKNGTKLNTSCSIRRVGRRWSIPRVGKRQTLDLKGPALSADAWKVKQENWIVRESVIFSE